MKTKITLLSLFLSLTILAQENTFSTFNLEYFKIPSTPITKMEGGTEFTNNVTLEFGKASKFQKEIDGIHLGYNKKSSKGAVEFNFVFKEPTAVIEKDTAKDKTYFYRYSYSTVCEIETKKDGKVIETVSFTIPGTSIKTISAAPIAIVDKYVKSPVFKVKAGGAKKKSLKKAISNIDKELTKKYSYVPSNVLLTYNQYEKGAQGRDVDFTKLNSFYNNYKATASGYKKDPVGTRTKLEEVLTALNSLVETKTSEGKYFYNVQEIHHLEVVKLEILTLQFKFDDAKKQIEYLNSLYIKGAQQKKIATLASELETNFKAAKASGLEFKF